MDSEEERNEEELKRGEDLGVFYASGTVEEIPNDRVAVVHVDHGNIGKVVCFRTTLKNQVRKSLQKVLKVGDTLSLRLRSRSGLYDSQEWFLLEASKDSEKQELKHKKPNPSWENAEPSSPVRLPFYKSRPRENRRYISNWVGVLRIEPVTGTAHVRLEHTFGSSVLEVDSPIVYTLIGNKTMDWAQLARIINREVRFDGEFVDSELVVKKMWLTTGIPWACDVFLPRLISEPILSGLKVPLCGKIASVTCRESAIAHVSYIPVLVPLKSLVTRDPIGSFSTMDMFLQTGSTIFVTVRRNGGYYIAEKCWRRAKSPRPEPFDEVTDESWLKVWGTGTNGFLKTGVLEQDGGKLFFKLKAEQVPVTDQEVIQVGPKVEIEQTGDLVKDQGEATLKLPLDPRKIFVNGFVATGAELSKCVGSELYYYVKYERLIVCAWSGRPPDPFDVLRNELSVPRGLVDESKYYEAIIDDFVLPAYAICRIGVVPVLLPLAELKNRRVGTKTGDIVSVCLEEVMSGGLTFLSTKTVATCKSGSLVLNFPGKIVELPTPVGLIVSDDNSISAQFELCCVKVVRNCRSTDVFSWFKDVRHVLRVGTKVFFSASCSQIATDLKKCVDVPQCAVEVCIDDVR